MIIYEIISAEQRLIAPKIIVWIYIIHVCVLRIITMHIYTHMHVYI